MHRSGIMKTWRRLLQVALFTLLLLLVGFEIVPSSSAQETQYIVIAGFQRAYSQSIERAAYALVYHSPPQQKQAMKDLKITLSAFQQEQTQLWHNENPDVQNLLQQAQPDYLSLVIAAQSLLTSPPEQVGLLDLDIILSYDRSFFASMNVVVTTLQQQSNERRSKLFLIRIVIASFCGVILVIWFLLDAFIQQPSCSLTERENSDNRW